MGIEMDATDNAAPKQSVGSFAPGRFALEDSMYDEFGNYIGPELDEDEGSDDELEQAWGGDDRDQEMADAGISAPYCHRGRFGAIWPAARFSTPTRTRSSAMCRRRPAVSSGLARG
jgi:hypothetical protein